MSTASIIIKQIEGKLDRPSKQLAAEAGIPLKTWYAARAGRTWKDGFPAERVADINVLLTEAGEPLQNGVEHEPGQGQAEPEPLDQEQAEQEQPGQKPELLTEAELAALVSRLAGLNPVTAKPDINQAAKTHNLDLQELRKAVKAKRQEFASEEERHTKTGFFRSSTHNNTFDPFDIRVPASDDPFLNPSPTLRKSGGLVEKEALVSQDEKGKQKTLIESKAAQIVADAVRGQLRFDPAAQLWSVWRKTHWEVTLESMEATKTIMHCVEDGTDPLGFRMSYASGIIKLIQHADMLPSPPTTEGVVPFRNGLFDIATRTLRPLTPDNALAYCLPHDYDPGATCPGIQDWLLKAVDGDADVVELLRAWLAALLRGVQGLQYFVMLLGRGGTGNGVFQRLAAALVGQDNIASSTLADIENNPFVLASFVGKRLAMINEAGRHGKSLDKFKALTGQDWLPVEFKNKQQTGHFIFTGMVLMASNEDMRSTDSTSGLERRRITIPFTRTATREERNAWRARGGEEGVLHVEIPGLINWILKLSDKDIFDRFEHLPEKIVESNLLGMSAGNSVADWMVENTVVAPGVWAQVGKLEQVKEEDGLVGYLNEMVWLYPNYRAWCEWH